MWIFCLSGSINSLSQQSHGLRCASVAINLLGLQVQIPLGHRCLSLVGVVCFQVVVSASGWSLTQRSLTKCGESECDCEDSIMRRPWLTRGYCDKGGINQLNVIYFYNIHYTLEILVIKAKQLSPPPKNPSLDARVSVSENHTFGLLMTLTLWQITLNVTWR
jgi:hypothetical protein